MDPYRNRLVETGINWGQQQIFPAANPLQEWLTELDPTLGWLFQKNRDGLQEQGISLRGRIGIARSGVSMKTTDKWRVEKVVNLPTFIKDNNCPRNRK